MTSGGQCVMMVGPLLMPVWCASSWVMPPLEVSANVDWCEQECLLSLLLFLC